MLWPIDFVVAFMEPLKIELGYFAAAKAPRRWCGSALVDLATRLKLIFSICFMFLEPSLNSNGDFKGYPNPGNTGYPYFGCWTGSVTNALFRWFLDFNAEEWPSFGSGSRAYSASFYASLSTKPPSSQMVLALTALL